MKFITRRDSETGKKFAEIEQQMSEVFKSQEVMANKYQIKEWRNAYWCVRGGFSAVVFQDDVVVDTKVWKNVNSSKQEWMPRLNNKMGKVIQKEFDAMPRVLIRELNMCIGYESPLFRQIGFCYSDDTYYGFIVDENWDITIPDDCEEVTTTRYKELSTQN